MQQLTIAEAINQRLNPKPATAPKMATQVENYHRCEDKYRAPILAFFAERGVGAVFHGNDLVRYVMERVEGDFDSPKRILRGLRAQKLIDYKIECKPKSLYRITAVPEAEAEAEFVIFERNMAGIVTYYPEAEAEYAMEAERMAA